MTRVPVADSADDLVFLVGLDPHLPPPVSEFRFHPTRQWRFDLAWPSAFLAVEVDGGTWTGGRHTSGSGYERDCEKLNEALCLGWRVIRVTPAMVEDGRAVDYIRRAFGSLA